VELARELQLEPAPWPPVSPAALVVNATPVGQAGAGGELPVPEALLDGTEVVCDLAYRSDGAETGLITAARARGIRAVDGLDVLVGQGAIAFRLLTGLPAPVAAMQAAVRHG
jgi:shikimate dehydrogenase